jgi:hypothetical protein
VVGWISFVDDLSNTSEFSSKGLTTFALVPKIEFE